MKPLPHTYDVRLAGEPTGYGTLTAAGLPDLRTAAPADFDGPGDAWSPEHMLLASTAACFLLTLRPVARLSKVEFLDIEIEATGTVNTQDRANRFTEIVLRPRVTVPEGADRDRLIRVLDKAKKTCIVTASLSTPVRLEAEIAEAAPSAS